MAAEPVAVAVEQPDLSVDVFSVCLNSHDHNMVMTKAMSEDRENGQDNDAGTGLIVEKSKPKLKKPPLYKVLLHNDDYTPMEFVVHLLMKFFHLSRPKAEEIMIHVHTRGVGVCGVFPREIAETKVRLVMDYALENQHPLQCSLDAA